MDKKNKFTIRMQRKLVVLFCLVLLAFAGLSVRLILINRDNGDSYKKQVLSQQQYSSTTIPYKRGEILDSNGVLVERNDDEVSQFALLFEFTGDKRKIRQLRKRDLPVCKA